ncbi:MAG TPA: hypothetical protein VN445_07735 [Rectinemataceae bacterium]|nr:hypothetical protein [Rectinemataceae bacterium]
MEPKLKSNGGKIAAQLMVGPEQLAHFGETGILACLDYVLDALAPLELILSITDSSSDLARKITERCDRAGTRVSLWVMVFADRPAALTFFPNVQDAEGRMGYGSTGAWENIGKGDEKFLFHCPSAMGKDEKGIESALWAAKSIGARGIFLDRIRYPSPANGLEFMSACSCPLCKEAYREWSGEEWPDLASLFVRHAAHGIGSPQAFLESAEKAFQFRSRMVNNAVARYADAAHAEGLSVGLDLFAPSLAGFVGQDYRSLSRHADFMKPMLYCKAWAPAGMPLEFFLMMKGLEESGVDASKAVNFVSELSGIDRENLGAVRRKGNFPASLAASELLRCQRKIDPAAAPKPEIYAGIELVQHEAYNTQIDDGVRDSYLESLEGQNIAVCWNILYVPKRHIDAIASMDAIASIDAMSPHHEDSK